MGDMGGSAYRVNSGRLVLGVLYMWVVYVAYVLFVSIMLMGETAIVV